MARRWGRTSPRRGPRSSLPPSAGLECEGDQSRTLKPSVVLTALPLRLDRHLDEAAELQRFLQELLVPGALVDVPDAVSDLVLDRVDEIGPLPPADLAGGETAVVSLVVVGDDA